MSAQLPIGLLLVLHPNIFGRYAIVVMPFMTYKSRFFEHCMNSVQADERVKSLKVFENSSYHHNRYCCGKTTLCPIPNVLTRSMTLPEVIQYKTFKKERYLFLCKPKMKESAFCAAAYEPCPSRLLRM